MVFEGSGRQGWGHVITGLPAAARYSGVGHDDPNPVWQVKSGEDKFPDSITEHISNLSTYTLWQFRHVQGAIFKGP